MLFSGEILGAEKYRVDIAVDPIDGTRLTAWESGNQRSGSF